MFESKYSKLLTGLLIAGIIAVIGILAGIGIYITNNAKLKKSKKIVLITMIKNLMKL